MGIPAREQRGKETSDHSISSISETDDTGSSGFLGQASTPMSLNSEAGPKSTPLSLKSEAGPKRRSPQDGPQLDGLSAIAENEGDMHWQAEADRFAGLLRYK